MKRVCGGVLLACVLHTAFVARAHASGNFSLTFTGGVCLFEKSEGGIGITGSYYGKDWGAELRFMDHERGLLFDVNGMYKTCFFCVNRLFTTIGIGATASTYTDYNDDDYVFAGMNIKNGMEFYLSPSAFISLDFTLYALADLSDVGGKLWLGVVFAGGVGFRF